MSSRVVGRYTLFDEIARGGMASIHLARLTAAAGFSRTLVVKRMQPEIALDPQFCAMFVDEARVAARVQHPNVVQTLDVISEEGELLLVLDYVHGASLSVAIRAAAIAEKPVPIAVANAIVAGTLRGLQAAHTATNEQGEPLSIVHRDVSPQNILVGVDGIARLIDFGVAKAVGRLQTTDAGELRGKLAYMPPEQVLGRVSAATDLYAAGVVLWEAWTGRRFFDVPNEAALVMQIMEGERTSPRIWRPDVSEPLESLIMQAVAREPLDRFASAADMADALERVGPVASFTEVGAWVREVASDSLARRAAVIATIEAETASRPDAASLSSRRRALEIGAPDSAARAISPGLPSVSPPSHASLRSQSRQIFSVAAFHSDPPRSRRRAWGARVAMVGLLGLVAAFGGLQWHRSKKRPDVKTAVGLPESDGVRGVATVPAPPPSSPHGVAAIELQDEPKPPRPSPMHEPVAVACRPKPGAKAAKHSVPAGSPPLPTASSVAVATPSPPPALPCDPPYDIDPSTGDKRYKRECLRR